MWLWPVNMAITFLRAPPRQKHYSMHHSARASLRPPLPHPEEYQESHETERSIHHVQRRS